MSKTTRTVLFQVWRLQVPLQRSIDPYISERSRMVVAMSESNPFIEIVIVQMTLNN